ncbi:phosphotransferase [Zhongshania sp.]|uniref:phosphotransferase n=1 Tax=Zhongshania sp. TaxID=1971902 RepID=UPI003567D8D7
MEIAFDPAPRQLDVVLSPAWLSAMLSTRWPETKVLKVTVVETLVTQATKVRLSLELEGQHENIPRHICIKGVLSETGAPGAASIIETQFYKDFAEQLPLRVPNCIYAEFNAAGDNGVIVMEDEIYAGSTFLTALKPLSPEEVRGSMEQLALLHAETWEDREFFSQAKIPRFLDRISEKPIMPIEVLQGMVNADKGALLPEEVKNAAALQRSLELYAKQVRERPSCLVHGDAHAGNIYRKDGNYGLVDWQILQKGEWAQDVAYHIASVLSPEDRRIHERELLEYYLKRLKALGGPELAADEAWTRYRAAMIYGYYLWAITQKVEPAITNEFFRRLGLAVYELNSFEAAGA